MNRVSSRQIELIAQTGPWTPASPVPLWPIGVLALVGLLTPNPLLTAASIGCVGVFVRLLWIPGEPPAMLFAVLYQWISVVAEVFQADWEGVDINAVAQYAPTLETTIWLSLIGLTVLSIGLRLGRGRMPTGVLRRVDREQTIISIPKVARLYAVAYAFSIAYPVLIRILPPGRQIFLAATDVRWVFFFILTYLVFAKKSQWKYFWIPFAIEFIGGIGFFSGFKTVFFFTFIAVLFSDTVRVTFRSAALGGALAIVLLGFGLLWTNVKGDFRTFLSQGTSTQSVRVSEAAKYRKFVDLVGEVDAEDLSQSFEPMLERLAYVDIFSAAVDYVPDQRPHTGGEIWGNALSHIFQPRIFFPGKPPLINDAVRTNRYTGLSFTTKGTSVSMGYMADSYIDFGPYFMYIPVLLLGLLWGKMYRFFVFRSSLVLLGMGMGTVVMVQASKFGMEAVKLIGSTVMIFLVFVSFLVVADRYAAKWMLTNGQ